jgi:hypothetical protein
MSYIATYQAVVHELGHSTTMRLHGLRPTGICWPEIFNFRQPDGTVNSIMHGQALATVTAVRAQIAPGVWRYKPELAPQLLQVAAAGVAAEILAAGDAVSSETIAPLFAHRNQDGDRDQMREMLGREPGAEDLLDACSAAARLLEPLMPALLREAATLATAFETMSQHSYSGMLYEDSLNVVLARIVESAERHEDITVPV